MQDEPPPIQYDWYVYLPIKKSLSDTIKKSQYRLSEKEEKKKEINPENQH